MERQLIIVSRDDQFRTALRRVCSGLGCRVETTRSVETALEIAVRRPVGVVVADISIQEPGDGEGIVKSVHEQNPDAVCFLIIDAESTDVSSLAENERW